METEEEIYIYDFSAIVAGVGGSLGLFLGFSCLQVRLSSNQIPLIVLLLLLLPFSLLSLLSLLL